MTTHTAHQILAETRAEFAAIVADHRPCRDLTEAELELGGSMLAQLASEDGAPSLRSLLNDWSAWDRPVSEVGSMLINGVACGRARESGMDFGDVDEFLAAAE